jgi:hypothetical protein
MPMARASKAGVQYAPLDLNAVQVAVSAGKPIRVGILPSAQFPDGGAGRVLRVGKPEVDGAEFIEVEVTVGGSRDTLPFSPTELAPLKRGQQAPVPVVAASSPSTSRRTPTIRKAAAENLPNTTAVLDNSRNKESEPLRPPPAKPPVRRGRKADAMTPLPFELTISSEKPGEPEWVVTVTVAGRSGKPLIVGPGLLWSIVEQLGDAEISRSLRSVLDRHRRIAETRAAQLAQELAAAQAELARFPTQT